MSTALALSQIPYTGLAAFTLVTSGTPGPNNLLLAHSGLAFGLRRTLPTLLGVYLGCTLLFALCAFGLAGLLSAAPWVRPAMSYAGGAYLARLGVGMLKSNWAGKASRYKPLACGAAALVQLVNPKLWWMCAFTLARFSPPSAEASTTLLVAATFMLCSLPCLLAYASLGSLVTRFSQAPDLRRRVNLGLAAATLLTAAGVVIGA